MFGKNYDEEIKKLTDTNINILKQGLETREMIVESQKCINDIQMSMIDIAKVQATHKESITFLLNHATVDADAEKDFLRLLKNIGSLNEIVKKSKK